ncbi:MAG: DUF3299 domain-containing protein [Pirellulaceae bacterium]|nr:DUF3299 domain-containing protein [Pirellulaceae bacterium]
MINSEPIREKSLKLWQCILALAICLLGNVLLFAETPVDGEKPKPTLTAEEEAKAAQEKRARELAKLRGEITFDDLKFDIEKDGIFEDSMLTDSIRALHEKKVRIRGFMLPSSVFQTKGIKNFVLVRDNKECCFGPGAAIYDCIMVEMAPGKTTDYQDLRVMTVSGVLSIDTESYQFPDGGHYAIFKLIATEAK